MDLAPFLQTIFCFLVFVLLFCFLILSLFVFVLKLKLKFQLCCNCETCQGYHTSSWSLKFDNLCDWYTDLLRKSQGNTIHVHVLGNVITANPQNVEHILKTRFENYPKGKPFSAILGDLLGNGIFNVDGDLWKFQRKMACLELSTGSLRYYAYEIVNSEIKTKLIPLFSAVAAESESRVVDLQQVFRAFSFDNIFRFSFGLDPSSLNLSQPISQFAEAFDLASKLSAERALTPSPFVWKIKKICIVGSEKKLKEAIKLVNMLAEEVIRLRREMGFSDKKDLLSRFMSSTDNDQYLRDIIISFLLAGRDTVASALTSFFSLLAQHPEVESAIRVELDKILGFKTQETPNFEQMKDMHYLQAALYESMRLYPPVQFDSKFCQEDDLLPDGTFVQKNTRVTYHPYAMGRMERIWGPDCLEFKPERWLKDGIFVPESLFKYPVFQAGLRVCLGKELAIMEMKSVALSLIRRFDIRVASPKHTPKFEHGLTASVQGGIPVFILESSALPLPSVIV